MKKNLLVTLADEKYVDQAKQLFSSAYWNGGWKGDYMLLAHEIPEKKLKWFRDKGILIKKCEPFCVEKIEGYPVTVLSKFYLFTPYFKKWKNIVYLDSDMLVEASLEELTKIKGFAAIRGLNQISKLFMTPLSIKIQGIDLHIFDNLKRGYNLKEPGFKSGFMAFRTEIIKEGTFPLLKKLFWDYKEIIYGDEAIFNLLFYKKWIKLPSVYNIDVCYLPINFKKIKSGKIRGIILHLGKGAENSKDYFYNEWKSNLSKAELINLKKIQASVKEFNKEEIREYEKLLEKNEISFGTADIKIKHFINIHLGLLGIFLRKNFPKLYYELKKLKDRK